MNRTVSVTLGPIRGEMRDSNLNMERIVTMAGEWSSEGLAAAAAAAAVSLQRG